MLVTGALKLIRVKQRRRAGENAGSVVTRPSYSWYINQTMMTPLAQFCSLPRSVFCNSVGEMTDRSDSRATNDTPAPAKLHCRLKLVQQWRTWRSGKKKTFSPFARNIHPTSSFPCLVAFCVSILGLLFFLAINRLMFCVAGWGGLWRGRWRDWSHRSRPAGVEKYSITAQSNLMNFSVIVRRRRC